MSGGGLPGDIDPALRAALARLAELGLVTPDPATVGIEAARRINEAYFGFISEPMPPVASVESLAVAGPGGPIGLMIVRPDKAAPGSAILYFHGGGYAFASLHTHERLMRVLALASGAQVIGVDYRRTPEHPYPAALEDALIAWRWFASGGDGRFGAIPAAFFGDSAGAHLALTAALRLRDGGERMPDALALAYGMYEPEPTSPSHARYGDGSYGLSTARMNWFWSQLLRRADDAADPYAVPARADPARLPPVAAFIAERDCLADDTRAFVGKLPAAGVPHSLDLFADMTHGFLQLGALVPAADAALGLIGGRIAELLRP